MKKHIQLLGLASVLLLSTPVLANQIPKALATDHRMRIVPFNQNDVVTLIGSQLVVTSLEFGDDEVVTGVEGGDAAAWEVAINKSRPNIVFIKPTVDDSNTNLTVLTSKHTYHFWLVMPEEIKGSKKVLPTYNVRFTYPLDDAQKALNIAADKSRIANAEVANNETNPLDWNFNYTYSCKCSKDNIPIRAFDDGKFTYFQFKDNHDNPAIFIVDGKGHESLANWHMKGQYVVIERTAPQFTIRSNGMDNASCVFNQQYTL